MSRPVDQARASPLIAEPVFEAIQGELGFAKLLTLELPEGIEDRIRRFRRSAAGERGLAVRVEDADDLRRW
jgi:hypothetical protein